MGLRLLGGNPARGTTGHLQSSVCRLQAPAATGAHNQCFQQVQEDMSKVCSVCKDWDFVSRGTEISVGRFLIKYFTPLTLERQHQSALSDEDVTGVWTAAKLEAIRKVRKIKVGVKGAEAPNPDEKEVEKTFWLSRPDGWVVNKKTKRIIMLEFKRASDTAETLLRHESNSGEAAHSHLGGSECFGGGTGMDGGSFASGRRATFRQGKRVARGHEDVWD